MLMSPKSTRLALGLLFALFLAQPVLQSQDVILQGFYWNTNPGDISNNSGVWWDTIAGRAPYLANVGFKTVWTPPANKGFGNVYDMGYGVYDYYDFGEYNQKGSTRTRHGNKAQLQSMISALHGSGIKVMADLVLNHRGGGDALEPEDCDDGVNPTDAWTDFNPASGRLPMDAADFHPNFTHCDVFAPYHDRLFFEDLCYFNFLDQTLDPPANDWYFGPHNLGRAGDSLIVWGRYLLDEIGFDEVRLDAVKHIEPGFLAPFLVELATPNQPFAVGELFDGNLGTLVNYRNEVENFVSDYGIGSKDANLAIFDFNLRYALRDMCNGGGGFNMWNLNTSGLLFGGGLPGEDVVTFVENHDVDRIGWQVVDCGQPHQQQVGSTCLALSTDSGHDPIFSDKEDMGYPYIMAAEGRPTVFWKDLFWYGLKEDIEWQMALRAATAKGGSGRIQDLNPFFTAGHGGDLFVMNRYGTTNGASDGLVLALNDNPSSESSAWVNTPFSNKYLKDYSDGYLFVTTQAFADSRANVKAQSRDYAWWSVTGLYPKLPGTMGSHFQMDATPGGCPHFIALRAADATNLLVNGAPIAVGDEVAVKNGAGDIVGIGRIGQGFQWDGVHDMIIEVLGAPSANGMGNGEQFSFVVYDASAMAEVAIGYVQYATAGSGFTFSPDRADTPNRNGNFSTFNLTATATGLYTCGGITRVLVFGLPVVPLEEQCGATSQANAGVYDNDGNQIQNGDNDGARFLPWTGRNPASNNGNAGLFNGNSATNGDGDGNSDGDINTGGEAWGFYANSSKLSEAIRPFASPLAVGQTFSIKMDNGWIDGGTVGLGLRNSLNNNVWEFFFVGGQAKYQINASGGVSNTLVDFTDEGLRLDFLLTSSTTWKLTLTQLANGNVTTYTGTLMNPAGGSTIDRVRLFNFNAGPDGQRNAFFNSMQICDPPALVINEVDYEQPGADNGEFVELRNMNTTTVNLDDFTLQLVNGSGDVVYENFNLPNVNLAAGDYYVVCLGGYSGPECDLSFAAAIQNGAPDAVRLMWNGVRVDALSYEGDVPSAVEGTGTGLLDPDTTPNVGLSRVPNGSDTDQNNVDFELTCITPGAANAPDNTDTDNDGAPDGCDDCPLAQNQGNIPNFNQATCDCDPGYYAVTTVINGQTVIIGCNPCDVVSAGSNSPVCEGNTLNLNSSTGVSHNWSGPNGFASAEQNPSIPGATLTAAGLYTVTVIDQNGCEGTSMVNVVIEDLPEASISYSGSPYCPNSGTVNVTLTGDAGGTFSSTPAGLVLDPMTGDVDTDASAQGTYTVTYTIPAAGACLEVTATTTIAILSTACTISGKLIWKGPPANTTTGVANATVFLSGDDSDTFGPTLAAGDYSFTGFTGSNFSVKPQKTSGMFNGVNVGDATAIQVHLTGPPYVTDFFRLVAADVNKSNTITTLDATLIKQALLGNPTANNILNNTKSWRFISSSFVYPNPAGPFNLPAGMPETRSVTGQATGQDFFGIKVGDFLETATPALSPTQMEPLVWRIADRKLQAGEPLEVTFTASNFEDIAAYQFALDFDPGALEFRSLEVLTDLIPLTLEGNFGLINIEKGELRALFSMLPGQTLPAEHPVFRLNFTVLESGQMLSEVLQISQEAIPAMAFNTALDETVVELEFYQEITSVSETPAGERRVVLLQNRPNPFDRETTIGFILPEACEAQLRVFDLNGREWWKTSKQYGAGYQEEIVRLEQAGAAGLLFCELATPFGVVTGKMAMTGN